MVLVHSLANMYIFIWIFVFKVCFCYHTLLFTTRKDIRFAHITKSRKIYTIVKDLKQAHAVDYLYNDSLVCWTDHTNEEIDCITFNGTHTGSRVIFEKVRLPSPDGLACDWLTKNLYWTDSVTKRIEVKSLVSRHRKVIIWQDLDQPRGIAVDPFTGLLFWTDWGEIPKIESSSMDGDLASRKIIVSDNMYWPNSISLDITAKNLYWCDGKLHTIEVIDYDGRNRKVLASKGVQYPFALTLDNDKIFWTDWKTYSIYSLDRKGGISPIEIFRFEDAPTDIEVYNATRQPYKRTPCEENNGGCSHICLLSSNAPGYSCACPTGIKQITNITCASQVEQFLLLVQRTEISKISLDTPDHTNIELPLKGIKHAIGIDYDPVEDYIYYTEDDLKKIQRAKLDGTKQEDVIVHDIFNPDGIAVDAVARNIYWSDTGANRIEVSRLDTSFRKTLIVDDLEKPRAVALSSQHGWLFWSDWNDKRPKIERSDLDGMNRLILVQENINWPNGIALDIEKNRLYWADAKTDKIEVINMEGNDRREILSDNLPHVFGLSLLGNYLYWTDWQRRTLDRVHVNNIHDRQLILDQLQDVMGIKAVGRTKVMKNSCTINNGDCQQFCFNKPSNKYVCSCQIEYELGADNRSCVIPDAFIIMYSNNYVRRVSIQNSANQDTIPITGLKSVSAIDVDVANQRLYWADHRSKTINRAFLNGSLVEKVVEFGLHMPESLAIDWLSSNLYWADAGTKRIEVIKLNGQFRRTIFCKHLKEPRNLVLDPRQGYMFWSEWDTFSTSGTLVKATMDGSFTSVIVSDIGRVNGLTIDYSQRFLYWTQDVNNVSSIEVCDSDGKNRRQLVKFTSQFKPFSITQHEDYIYWSNWLDGSVMQANKYTGRNRVKFFSQTDKLLDLRIVHSSKQSGWNACTDNNGNCKYLCLVKPGISHHTTERICTCPTHYKDNNGICVPPDSFLLFSQRNSFHRLSKNTNECPDVSLPVSNLKSVCAIEYDPQTKYFYWIDSKVPAIKRCYENGSHSSVVISGNGKYNFYDIVLDPINRVLFWSCATTDTINVTRFNNSSVGIVFKSSNDEKPRNLAIHPEKGLLFWTDVGIKPKIISSRLDGQHRTFIDTDGQNVETLAVDRQLNVLFYVIYNRIFTCDFYGNNKMFFLEASKKIFGIAVLDSFLYWFDKDTQRVQRVDTHSGQGKTTIADQISQITDLLAVPSVKNFTNMSHPCSDSRYHGNCSHMCMISLENNEEVECSCPVGFKLDNDKKTCSVLPFNHCPDGLNKFPCCVTEFVGTTYFRCLSDNTCIAENLVCDGLNHCDDNSDESSIICSKNFVKSDSYVEDNSNTIVLFALLFIISFIFISAFIVFKFRRKRVKHSPVNQQDVTPMSRLGSGSSYTSVHNFLNPQNYPLNPPPSPSTTVLSKEECSCEIPPGPAPSVNSDLYTYECM